MKKVVLILIVLYFGLIASKGSNTNGSEMQPQKDKVEVLYFHGKQRCATCMAIERETKAVINKQFANAIKNKKLKFHVIDISKAQNEAIAKKHEITWSSLVIVKYKNGKEQVENITRFAFANARNKPDIFRNELTQKLNELLK